MIKSEEGGITVRLSSREFTDIMSAISNVRDEYDILDKAMLDVPLERIERLDDSLAEILAEAQRIR